MPDSTDIPLAAQEDPAMRLWHQWQQGGQPDVRQLLRQAGRLDAEQVLAVLRVDQRERWQRGQALSAETYLKWFPVLADDPEKALELICAEYVLRQEMGQTPEAADYLLRFPHHAARFQQRLELHQALTNANEAATESSPPGTARPAEDLPPLPSVPGYEVLEVLGKGGMGVVYKARQIKLNRIVALKMILAGQLASADQVRRFHAEAEAAAHLDHPNIVPIHEVGDCQGQHYFSMKLIQGNSLARQVPRFQNDPRAAAQLLAQVARAVHYAHQHGILHRDLKPANILLDEHDQPHVTDFGLSRQLEQDSALTQSGAIVGTPSYMAPEQASASRALTTAIDVYGLGAILYQALTGQPPFRGANTLDTLMQVREKEPVRPRLLEPRIDRDLETICIKCLEKDPQRRYGSAEALADDLDRYLAHEPIRARRSNLPERAFKWARRRPAIAALTATLLVLTVTAFAVVTWSWQSADGARDRAERAEAAKEEQRRLAVAALQQQARANKKEEQGRRKFQRLYVEQLLDKAATLAEQDEVARAALWLARGLEQVAPEDRHLQRVLRLNLGQARQQLSPLRALLAHQKRIRAAVFSRDGKWLLTASDDRTACLWDQATGKRRTTLTHAGVVHAAAFTPDSKVVVTATQGAVHLWTVDGRAIGKPLPHPALVVHVLVSPDGKRLLSCGSDRVARLWDVADPRQARLVAELRHDRPGADEAKFYAFAFSPTSKFVVTAGRGGIVQLWQASTGQAARAAWKRPGDVLSVAFRNRTTLAAGGSSGLRLWTAGKDRPIAQLRGLGRILAVACSPDGKLLATGSADGKAQLFSGAAPRASMPHPAAVVALAFSPDNRTLLTTCRDQSVRLWDAELGAPLGAPLAHLFSISDVAFSPDGKTILSCGPGEQVHLWEALHWPAVRRPILQDREAIRAVAYSPDGKRIVAACNDGVARLWDAVTGKRLGKTEPHDSGLSCVAFSPDGKSFLTAGGRAARLWEGGTARALGQVCRHQAVVNLVAFRPDGRMFVTVAGSRAQLWDVARQQQVGSAMEHRRRIGVVAFSPDGSMLLTAGGEIARPNDGARLWDAQTGKSLGVVLDHPAEVISSVAFSPDGKRAVTAGDDGSALLWEVKTGKRCGPALPHHGAVERAIFSRDGKLLLTGSDDRAARLWDTATGKLLVPPLTHPAAVQSVAFSGDGGLVATGCRDGAARMWDTATGKPVGFPLRHRTPVRFVAFLPGGKTLLSSGFDSTAQDRTLRLWTVPTPLRGEVKRLVLWAQVVTGLELDAQGSIRMLTAKEWRQRRQRLAALGGPPAPGE
jgi:WD40 repeat protein/tRNA A-37 threonylcarbamoyl transferase component Bud32